MSFLRCLVMWSSPSDDCELSIEPSGPLLQQTPQRIANAVRTFAPIVTSLTLAGSIPLQQFCSATIFPRLRRLTLDGRPRINDDGASDRLVDLLSIGGCPKLDQRR